jgi:membrane fusion protein, multidrug efflux system
MLLQAAVLSLTVTDGAAAQTSDASTEIVAPALVQKVQEKTLTPSVVAYGKAQSRPADVTSITAPHDGIVGKVYVRTGQAVQRNEPIAELMLAAASEEAYQKAKTAADFAKAKLARMRYLWSKKDITRDKIDQAEIAYRDAAAALESQRKIGAQELQETITSPRSGTVTAVSVSEGDRIKQDAKLISLAPSNIRAVLLGVEVEDIGRLRIGMSTRLMPAFASSETYSGKITGINAAIDPSTRLVDVLVELEPSAYPLPIGSYVRGEIMLDAVHGLGLPREAILYDKNGSYVFVDKNDVARRVQVELGAEEDDTVLVTGEIKHGDEVVVQGNYELTNGMKIKKVDRAVR